MLNEVGRERSVERGNTLKGDVNDLALTGLRITAERWKIEERASQDEDIG